MSTTKTIPLKTVRDVLMCAVVRQKFSGDDGKRLFRSAAFTQVPTLNISCDEARRGHRPYPHRPTHFCVMTAGNLQALLARVRGGAGLAEVRRTWGAGMHTLQAEFAEGGMR